MDPFADIGIPDAGMVGDTLRLERLLSAASNLRKGRVFRRTWSLTMPSGTFDSVVILT
jgi:hypothetical protein